MRADLHQGRQAALVLRRLTRVRCVGSAGGCRRATMSSASAHPVQQRRTTRVRGKGRAGDAGADAIQHFSIPIVAPVHAVQHEVVQVDVRLDGRASVRWVTFKLEHRLRGPSPIARADCWRGLCWPITGMRPTPPSHHQPLSNRCRRRDCARARREQRRRVRLPRHPRVDHVGPLLQHVATLLPVLGLVVDAAR